MIDVSDGLSSDLAHIVRESGVGAVVFSGEVPVHPDAERAAQTSGRSPLDHALHDGEDFELLFTAAPADAERLLAHPPVDLPLAQVGEIIAEGFFLETPAGRREPLRPAGYQHPLRED